jgi:hypothetical protein
MVESGCCKDKFFKYFDDLLELRNNIPNCGYYKIDKGRGFKVEEVEERGEQEKVIPVYGCKGNLLPFPEKHISDQAAFLRHL